MMRRASMQLNVYGREAVRQKLKNSQKVPKMHFLAVFELLSDSLTAIYVELHQFFEVYIPLRFFHSVYYTVSSVVQEHNDPKQEAWIRNLSWFIALQRAGHAILCKEQPPPLKYNTVGNQIENSNALNRNVCESQAEIQGHRQWISPGVP